jgi:protein-S-isoprenylcysteine O-methyltransferase Ste14
VKPFFATNNLAGALVVATMIAAVFAEWAVTLCERDAGERSLGRSILLAAATLREVTLLRTGERRSEDRNTKWVLVGSGAVALALAWVAHQRLPGLAFPATGWVPTLLGLVVVWAGIGLRGWAIVTLGRFFRRDVQVAADQVVVRSGPYAAIRHPAYTGNLLIYAGAGLLLANWASLAALVVIPLLGLTPRIAVEESLLQARLGGPYRQYAGETSRLIPHLW